MEAEQRTNFFSTTPATEIPRSHGYQEPSPQALELIRILTMMKPGELLRLKCEDETTKIGSVAGYLKTATRRVEGEFTVAVRGPEYAFVRRVA